jgi:hypothetical protein
MRKFKTSRPRALPFRLFLIVAGTLLLTAAFAPRANATLLVYFNFEDAVTGGAPDFVADTIAAGNPGGGIQASMITTNYTAGDFDSRAGLLLNRSAGDIDTANPGQAVTFRHSASNNGTWIQFAVNATLFSNMTLTYATNNNGNGFTTQSFSYSTNGGATFTAAGSVTGLAGTQLVTFAVPALANNQPGLVLRITFSGGQSNGNDLQTIIDNIQLNGTAIPEPTTIAGGLLGVLGLCWFQRRRLKSLTPRSRKA